ncbi:aminotransferase class IV [Salinibacterium sp. ZJ454]|uniref:aminotransferase class IV n=1 Tax=Salinibacterium sp. ZJ454 TaxID=2708339 RepID=UPI001420F763|nr:aminotransferase class IV [Salinibacterium sp. ZJ454]
MTDDSTPAAIARWHDGRLQPLEYCDMTEVRLAVADSWLVTEGTSLALDLHRQRFTRTARDHVAESEIAAFWDAAIASIPRTGGWFPRVELQLSGGAPRLVARVRPAPERHRSIRLASHHGADPRTTPAVKGPDLATLTGLRTAAQARGADDTVILSPDGFIVDGATTAIIWWRGDALCVPSPKLARVDSVTATVIVGVATALGVDVLHESVTPDELDGLEVWAVNALHGIRIVTHWVDGPAPAELPGRLALWRTKLDALRRPFPQTP